MVSQYCGDVTQSWEPPNLSMSTALECSPRPPLSLCGQLAEILDARGGVGKARREFERAAKGLDISPPSCLFYLKSASMSAIGRNIFIGWSGSDKKLSRS